MSTFSTTPAILAVPLALHSELPTALAEYGSALPLRPAYPESPTRITLLGHIDRQGSDDLRAGELGVSVTGTALTNGKLAYSGHWTAAFLSALTTDERLDGIDVLTPEQFAALLPEPED